MDIGKRLKELREQRKLSQGDVEKRTGLLRCYVSRVENGHTVPAVETIEKMARALEIPLYQLFIGADRTSALGKTGKRESFADRREERQFVRFASFLYEMKGSDRELLLALGSAMERRKK